MEKILAEIIEKNENVYIDCSGSQYNRTGYDETYGWDSIPTEWIARALDEYLAAIEALPTYDELQAMEERGEATLEDTAQEGCCYLYELADGREVVVLSEGTVLTRAEDNSCPEGAIFPY